jgi:hypothetical protein
MATCKRCLLPERTFGVALDRHDVCNYCDYWDKHKEMYSDFSRLRPLFVNRIAKIRGRYPYDALAGLSGGKDSTYVLYKLIKDYDLKVLAVTVDNGFLSDYAKNNVRKIVRKLGVDHSFIHPDWEVHRSFYKAALEAFADPCVACAMAGYFHLTRICHEKKIPFFIHGRSPFQMFRNLYAGSGDVFLAMVNVGLQKHSFKNLIGLHTMIDSKLRELLASVYEKQEQRDAVYREFFLDPKLLQVDFVPEHLGYFVYHPYNEEEIKREMERELGYRRPPADALLGHGDCKIHDAASYAFEQVHGVSLVMPEIAVMLRRGLLSRAEAEAFLERHEWRGRVPEESIAHLCDRLGIGREEFTAVVEGFARGAASKYESH